MSVKGRRTSVSPISATDAWSQSRIAKKYPLYLPVPPSLLAGIPSDDDEVQAQLSRYSFLVEFSHVVPLIPSGIYVLPELLDSHVWRCAIFIREGLWRGLVAPFRLEFPKDTYPRASPNIIFDAPVPPHVAIDPKSGELQLPDEFRNNWSAENFCSIHVLLYVKQVFYDQQCILGGEESVNKEFRQLLLKSKTEALRTIDKAIRISVTYTARLISRGSNVCPLLVTPDVNNSDVPLPPLGMDDAGLLAAAVQEADEAFALNKDVSGSFHKMGSLGASPRGTSGGGAATGVAAPAAAPAATSSSVGSRKAEDRQTFDEERLNALLAAIQSFAGPSGRVSDPVDGFLEWFTEDVLSKIVLPLPSSRTFMEDSTYSLAPSTSSTPKVVVSTRSHRRASHA